MHILVTGATGLLGRPLVYELVRQGHKVSIVTRSIEKLGEHYPGQVYQWPGSGHHFPHELVQSVNAVIHLAGAGVADKRWTEKQKKLIYDSRIHSTRQLVNEFRSSSTLQTFICASGVGIYGHQGSAELTEDHPRGKGFLADVCEDWEKAALEIEHPDRRVVLLRTGAVLTRRGGFQEKMEGLFRNNLGGSVAGGEQYIPWIHETDWINSVIHCLNSTVSGPVNLSGPAPETQRNYSIRMGKVLRQNTQLPAPGFAVKLGVGEMADLALDSINAVPKKLIDSGFDFKFEDLDSALNDLYKVTDLDRETSPLFMAYQWVPAPIEKVFDFFKDEKNLEKLTPPFLGFKVDKKSTEKLGPGTLIDYSLKIHGLPAKWQSRIDHWDPPLMFSDTQLKGPYKKWFHVHSFESLGQGTLLTDRVLYELPLGRLGQMFGGGFVRGDVQNIFAFRKKTIFDMYS